MINKLVLKELTQTCGACPSQWEGTTIDDQYVYVRYRWGYLSLGYGKTLMKAIESDYIGFQVGDRLDGVLDTEDMLKLLQDSLDVSQLD